jgi:hypothetical protein
MEDVDPGLTSKLPALPNEVWVDILHYLPLETLWYSTRPACSLFYDISTSIVKASLVDGSSCSLRHYISFKDPLLPETLYPPPTLSKFHERILKQEGHSAYSQILLWSSPSPSPANPQDGPGIPTINYESADGKKCVTMAVFGQQERNVASTSSSVGGPRNSFHCRRTGCNVTVKDSASDGHVCLAGCWHVHYSRVNREFCATIPMSILLSIYLRLEMARREKTIERGYSAIERKGRWNGMSRHGVSASVSPLAAVEDILQNMMMVNPNGTGVLMDVDHEMTPGPDDLDGDLSLDFFDGDMLLSDMFD